MFFHATLFEALSFGCTAAQRNEKDLVERIKATCLAVGVNAPILKELDDPRPRDWTQTISQAQLKKIHLARAFIANPEVLVLDRPTAGFDFLTLRKITQLFTQFVEGRGLIDDGATHNDHLKRP